MSVQELDRLELQKDVGKSGKEGSGKEGTDKERSGEAASSSRASGSGRQMSISALDGLEALVDDEEEHAIMSQYFNY